MAILDVLAAALAMTAPAQEFDMAAQPDLCATDPAAVVHPNARGVTAHYVFQLETTLTPPVDAFFDGLDRARFAVGTGVQTRAFSLVFVQTRIPARDAEQVRAEAKILCGFAAAATGKMALFERFDAGDRAKQERERANKAAAERKRDRAVEKRARKELADKLARPVSVEEVAALLRSPEMLGAYFDSADPGLKLGRIRALKCTPMKERRSSCRIALPIFQRGEPDYAEIQVDFWRDDSGALHFDDGSQNIVVN